MPLIFGEVKEEDDSYQLFRNFSNIDLVMEALGLDRITFRNGRTLRYDAVITCVHVKCALLNS